MAINEVSIKMNTLPVKAESKVEAKQEQASQINTQESVSISDGKQTEKKSFKEKVGGWLKNKIENAENPKPLTTSQKVGRVLLKTAAGAATGAAIIAIGASPVALGVVSAVVGGVVAGGVGAILGGLAGGLIGGCANGEAEKGATKGALIGGIGLGALGAVGSGMSGFAEAHVLTGIAAAMGGGPIGGAIAGGILSGAYAVYKAVTSK